jgi:hypothetical protein
MGEKRWGRVPGPRGRSRPIQHPFVVVGCELFEAAKDGLQGEAKGTGRLPGRRIEGEFVQELAVGRRERGPPAAVVEQEGQIAAEPEAPAASELAGQAARRLFN